MFYFREEPVYLKIKEVADRTGFNQNKLYVWIRDMERHGITTFKKTPLGSTLIEEKQIKVIEEYVSMRGIFNTPKEASIIVKNTSTFQPKDEEDFSWAKQLKYAIWRRH